jgi:hypothetical protein
MNNLSIVTNTDVSPAIMMNGETQVTQGYRTAATSKGATDGRVSSQWSSRPDDEKFLSLGEMYNALSARSSNSQSRMIDPSQTRVTIENDMIGLNFSEAQIDQNVAMTHYSFGQLCARTKISSDYLRKLPAKLAAINLQHGLMAYEGDAMQAFSYHTGAPELRAMTGENYGRIYDHQVVDQVMRIAGNGTGDTRWKVPGVIDWSSSENGTVIYNPFVDITKENTTLYASDRDVYLFLVDDTHPIEVGKLKNGDPDLMFRGFIVWNSETGSKSFGMTTMMLRGVCQNRNLWGVEGTKEMRIRHSRLAPERFASEASPILLSYSTAPTASIVSKVRNAKMTFVARNDEERIDFLTDKVGLSKPISDKVLAAVLNEEEKAAESIWDMVQGITAVARTYKHQDARLALETQAGKLMDKIAA